MQAQRAKYALIPVRHVIAAIQLLQELIERLDWELATADDHPDSTLGKRLEMMRGAAQETMEFWKGVLQ